ncbi:hypothetical protein [Polyangium aurulentum]|uniref:hypothetical protein n=1 Tax=Polyangium aurulentum TaxID=2567896 RepID=UPI0010AE752C|nr:hypothetical protein [Polyangium aurulentum]UQA59937.1 hypothetical protein E8A73_005445 [Polyangium aurulentum]
MGATRVNVTPELLELMRLAVEALDAGEPVDGDDLIQSEHGYGGRIAGSRFWEFTFFPESHDEQWLVTLSEEEVRGMTDDDEEYTCEILATVEPYKRPAPQMTRMERTEAKIREQSLGHCLLARMLAQKQIELRRSVALDAVASAMDRIVYDALDNVSLTEHERAEEIVDGITLLAGVEDVFASNDEILFLIRHLAK